MGIISASHINIAQAEEVAPIEEKRDGTCKRFRHLFERYDDWNVDKMVEICTKESGGNEYAFNKIDDHGTCQGSHGLMQIGCLHAKTYRVSIEELNNPEINISIAHTLYKERGYRPWGVCYDGKVECF